MNSPAPEDRDNPARQPLNDAHFSIAVLVVTSVTLITVVLMLTLWMSQGL